MRGFIVALVGPDGAGKTTIAGRLPDLLGGSVRTLYAGDNPDRADRMLPTTRLLWWHRRRIGRLSASGPPSLERKERRSVAQRIVTAPWRTLLLVNQCAEEWARLRQATRWVEAGYVVVLDRSFLHDYWHHDVVAPHRSPLQRVHGWWLTHGLPRADMTVVLDAPAEVLFSRKAEGTVQALSRRRSEYDDVGHLSQATVVVDATRPLSEVEEAVADAIRRRRASRDRGI